MMIEFSWNFSFPPLLLFRFSYYFSFFFFSSSSSSSSIRSVWQHTRIKKCEHRRHPLISLCRGTTSILLPHAHTQHNTDRIQLKRKRNDNESHRQHFDTISQQTIQQTRADDIQSAPHLWHQQVGTSLHRSCSKARAAIFEQYRHLMSESMTSFLFALVADQWRADRFRKEFASAVDAICVCHGH